MARFDPHLFRKQFPILGRKVNGKALVYFDNAATTQSPSSVIDGVSAHEQCAKANVHRASHALSSEATLAFEQSRTLVKTFINAKSNQEIIWTKGTTEAINLVANTWGMENLAQGDEILLSQAEHHANIVPWQIVAEKVGAKIKVIPLDEQGRIELSVIKQLLTPRTKLVSVNHISNVIGKINPIEAVIEAAKSVGAKTFIDGAQAIAHEKIDVDALDCDFYAFSGHKMYGPTGVGVLYGKKGILEEMPPYQGGGEMIKKVSFSSTTYNTLPFKFEAGTPNISGVIGLAYAIRCLQGDQQTDLQARLSYERSLNEYAYQALNSIEAVNFISQGKPDVAIYSFTVKDHHNHDVASFLDSQGIAVRSGHHCAMPLMQYLNIPGCIRLSLTAYNTKEEIDYTVHCLKQYLNGQNDQDVIDINGEANRVRDLFAKAKSWDQKHREIMLLGKQLPRLAQHEKSDETLIEGCESKAWLTVSIAPSAEITFAADSDAKVIRGLLYIVLAFYQGKTAKQILTADVASYIKDLGLSQHLSPSRSNGLHAIIKRINEIAEAN